MEKSGHILQSNFSPNTMRFFDLFKRSKPLLNLLKEYFEYISPGKTQSTIEKYGYYYDAVEKFLIDTKQTNLRIHSVRFKTMEQMRSWLHSEKHRTREHVSRHLKHCKAAFDYAIQMEYIDFNPICSVKTKRDKAKEVVSLEMHEVQKFKSYRAVRPTFQLAKDCFIFQVLTGISYMDLWIFEIKDEKKITWVTAGRGKNDKRYWSELTPLAKEILDRYNGQFPYICNQVYNKTVRKICSKVGISKYCTTHTARKTFATLKDEQGFSLETIADMLGNTPEVTRRHYINKSKTRVVNEINRLAVTT